MQPYEKKKVLYLITKSNWGGAQRYVYDLATSLPKDRFDVVVALGGNGLLKSNLAEAGIRTISIEALQRDISLLKEFSSFGEIWKIVGDERPDIFHVNSSKAGGIGALVGRLRGVKKIVYSAHGWAFNEDRNAISKLIIGFIHWITVMLAHVTIAVSNAVKHQMRWPMAQRKIVVVHNGRPAPEFLDKEAARAKCVEINAELAQYKNDTWTGTIAELHPVKRHDVMIEVVAKFVKTGQPVRHLIIGAGEAKTELQALVTKLDLQHHVFFLGHVDEAAHLMKAFDIFTLTSRSEALAYTIIEAAQAGLAIVASRVGGIPEILTHEWNGLLVPPGDVEALHSSLSELLADPAKRNTLAQKAQVRGEHFSLEKMVADTAATYQNVIR